MLGRTVAGSNANCAPRAIASNAPVSQLNDVGSRSTKSRASSTRAAFDPPDGCSCSNAASCRLKNATVERTVRKRGRGTIYVDYLQNIPGKTLACAYSARASAFAGVSTPLTWEEIEEKISPQDFTIKTIEARVREVGDLWAGLREGPPADLAAAIDKLQT